MFNQEFSSFKPTSYLGTPKATEPPSGQAKEAEAQVSQLEVSKAPLLQKLKDLEEVQRLKRAAVMKEVDGKKRPGDDGQNRWKIP